MYAGRSSGCQSMNEEMNGWRSTDQLIVASDHQPGVVSCGCAFGGQQAEIRTPDGTFCARQNLKP